MVLNDIERSNIYSYLERETDFKKDKNGKYSFDVYDDKLFATYKNIVETKEKYKKRILKYQEEKGLDFYYRGETKKDKIGTNLDTLTYNEIRKICIKLGLLKPKSKKKVKAVESSPQETISQAKKYKKTPQKIIIANTVYDDDGEVIPVQFYTKRELAYAYGLQITEEDEYTLLEQGIKIEDPDSYLKEIDELRNIIIAILLKYKATNNKKEPYKIEDLKLMNLSELEYVLITAQTEGNRLPNYIDLERKVLYKK